MRVRTTLALAGRAIAACAIGLGTLVSLGWSSQCSAAPRSATSSSPRPASRSIRERALVVALLLGASLTFVTWAAVRRMVRRSRRRLLRETEPIDPDGTGRVASSASRLAAQFDLPMPELRSHPATTPIACTTARDGKTAVVVSVGLLEAVPDAELEAVFAHEFAHVANGDQRLMTWVLVPLIASEEFYEMMHDEDEFDPRLLPWLVTGRLLTTCSRLGVGLFSRGREFAVDRAAVAATGEPDGSSRPIGRPSPRLASRARSRRLSNDSTRRRRGRRTTCGNMPGSVDALNILPTLDPARDGGGGLLATHPATERRIARLRRLVD
ncbi:M48 family metallopeptidase [Natrinema halophilum]|uniref:M48 family metalloprotease n=1 Tax=Natrinema halophilum TaxID=1699371 RepID=A0A7D5KKW8_9EURY|nr:M48 family metalloprotease [Natrinema halophilum]QLG50879.1 M48 family metalloprotease [Natrinema halophilum]